MPPTLRQLVTFSDCSSCRQCCKFDVMYRNFAPLINSEEKKALLKEKLISRGQAMPIGNDLHKIALIKHEGEGGGFQCSCLKDDMACGIQARKPFDCLLYPYVLMQTRSGKEVWMMRDDSCPGIQKRVKGDAIIQYEAYLKKEFIAPHMREFLERNKHVIERYQKNLKKVFRVW